MAEKSGKEKAAEKAAGGKTGAKKAATKARKTPSAAKTVAKPAKKKTAFRLTAPQATQVFIAGCFNDWNPTANPLVQEGEGTWMCTLMLEPVNGPCESVFVAHLSAVL